VKRAKVRRKEKQGEGGVKTFSWLARPLTGAYVCLSGLRVRPLNYRFRQRRHSLPLYDSSRGLEHTPQFLSMRCPTGLFVVWEVYVP